MAFFSTKKSKAKKAEKAAKAEQKKAEEQKPAAAPYKHTPSHAAADSQTHGASDRAADREQIAQESQKRLERAHTDSTLGNASGPQEMAQSAMHGRPTHSKSMRSSGTVNTVGRNNSSYFGQASQQAPSFDSPILGNPKMQAAARDRGYINPEYSADSGYSSVGPSSTPNSRAPSTHPLTHDEQQPPMLRQPSILGPGLTLGQELAREPAFSERSYTEEENARGSRLGHSDSARREHEEAILERAESTGRESVKSSRSSRSRKQTRFEEQIEPVPLITQQQQDRFQRRSQPAPSAIQEWQEQATQQPPSKDPPHTIMTAQADQEQNIARQNTRVSPIVEHQHQHEMMTPYGQNEQVRSLERGREPQQSYGQQPSTVTASHALQASARQASQNRQRSDSVPPLSILDGLKVNKRGRILDEEGDPIGELCDGDIMDCVRQKANAYGEILDEYGGVVGRVRTLPRDSHSVQRSSMSSRPGENEYFQRHFQLPSQIGNGPAQPRRQSLQQTMPLQHQDALHRIPDPQPQGPMASTPLLPSSERKTSVAPLDMQKSGGALELDASQPVESEPVFDFSEPFMPPPHVPARSPKRSESPSPVREYYSAGAELPANEQRPFATEQGAAASAAQASEIMVSRPTIAMGHSPAETEQTPVSVVAEQRSVIPEEDEDPTPRATPTQQARGIQEHLSAQTANSAQQASAAGARPLARGTSERQMSFTRPPMPPVPQDPPTSKGPTLFSYKGDIPTTDGPPPGLGPARVKSPSMPSFPRQAFAAGAAGGSPFAGTGVPGAPPSPSRRVSSNGVPMSSAGGMAMQRPGMKSRYSTNTPLVRSPLSSHETTPPESEEGSSESADRDQVGAMAYSKFRAHSRAPSVRTVSSVTSNGKPRTYFTHAGRVTVDAGELPPSAVAAQTAVKNAANPPVEKKEEKERETKKKSRLSMFGKKK